MELNKIKIIIVIIAALVLFSVVPKEFYSFLFQISKETEDKVSFDLHAEKVKLKKILIDSLDGEYAVQIKNSYRNINRDSLAAFILDSLKQDSLVFAYKSEIDTVFVRYDSIYRITDTIRVNAQFISPIPINPFTYHFANIQTNRIRDAPKIDTEALSLGANASAGYGLFTKKFDVYVGVGLSYKFNSIWRK